MLRRLSIGDNEGAKEPQDIEVLEEEEDAAVDEHVHREAEDLALEAGVVRVDDAGLGVDGGDGHPGHEDGEGEDGEEQGKGGEQEGGGQEEAQGGGQLGGDVLGNGCVGKSNVVLNYQLLFQ